MKKHILRSCSLAEFAKIENGMPCIRVSDDDIEVGDTIEFIEKRPDLTETGERITVVVENIIFDCLNEIWFKKEKS